MSDIQFGTESYQSMDSWSAGSESQTAANTSFLNGAPCSNGDCENTENPAEEAWVKLVSAIPVVDQVQNLKCVAQGTAAPSDDEVQSLVSQIRPDSPNNYALREISRLWMLFYQQFSVNPEAAVAPILRSKLTDLSNGWQGNDFDAFAEQMEMVFANCEQIASDIGTPPPECLASWSRRRSEIFSLQGAASGELPYPAPQYWVEDKRRPVLQHRRCTCGRRSTRRLRGRRRLPVRRRRRPNRPWNGRVRQRVHRRAEPVHDRPDRIPLHAVEGRAAAGV